ncbi:hypothetical protein [Paenibacillus radicis (ex Xue et al. 2023)]|uniref:Uncharacterized protein n=1 Tax=Paenibacillus radicis (ex Xue et al. 2023) TaxID=2972489 RepID=A0ABT1YK04_9BACL|nr:hypothetical protein [Paenibacillus radicis (ex Xue et al. 2023)]MCR8633528.1 hypothetical protein [Paenibacillus radicis (ex Xue et al. 2023)]
MADVEALITFLIDGGRTRNVFNGYRPAHLVKDDYLTTGIHNYYDKHEVVLGESVLGTITFIGPEAYPQCLWVGKKINIQEGSKIVGYAEIIKVFNILLLKKEDSTLFE